MPPPTLLIATGNPGKLREYAGLLRNAPFRLLSLADAGIKHEVEETGATFAENAWLKASEYAALSGMLTLADDSGLEVDALNGQPGVHSARYGPPPDAPNACRSDADRLALLLRNLENVPWPKRTARFRCVINIAQPTDANQTPPQPPGENTSQTPPQPPGENTSQTTSPPPGENTSQTTSPPPGGNTRGGVPKLLISVVGAVAGMIQYAPQGNDGFGYDPVFFLPSYGATIAQLSLDQKNRISHRGNAAARALAKLRAHSQTAAASALKNPG